MLTGHPPFEANAAAEVLAMHINEEPLPPSETAPHQEITSAADDLILKAIAKDPGQRYQTMDELRADLQRCYGSVAFKRNVSGVAGVQPVGKEGRAKRLTEELDEWLHSDQPRLSEREARILAMIGHAHDALDEAIAPDEEKRIADALDAALDED